MTNKELVDYLVVTGKINFGEKLDNSILKVSRYENNITDSYKRLSKLGLTDHYIILLISKVLTSKKLGDKAKEYLECLTDMCEKYNININDNIEQFTYSIEKELDSGIERNYNREILSNKIIINPKKINLEDKVYKVGTNVETLYTNQSGIGKLKYTLRLKDRITGREKKNIDCILYKNGKGNCIKFGIEDQTKAFGMVIRENKDFDFLVIADTTWDRTRTPIRNKLDKILVYTEKGG